MCVLYDNSLGELEREVDANGDELTYRYDVLGRMERRWLNSSLMGMWFYDSTASYGRKGMLDKEVSTDTNDPDRFEKYYRYDTTGDGKDYLKYTNNRIYEDGASAHHYTFFYVDNNYGRPTGMRYGDTNLSIQYEYNSLGYLTHIKNAHSSGYVYREITEQDGLGNMTGAMLGNAMYTQSQRHHLATGQMLKNRVTQQGSQVHHELVYDYGAFSNLSQSQVTVSTGDQNYEMYEYDSLHRLIKSERAFMEPAQANDVITYNYNELGNLVYKSDYGQTYAYGNGNANGQTAKTAGGNAGPNAIRALTRTANAGGGNTSYTYDNNGNMKTGDGRSLDYNVFNKPVQIIKNSVTTQFSYGADLMRYKQVKTNLPSEYGSTTQTTYYVDKHLEIEEQGTRTVYRHYIDGIAILNKEVDGSTTDWKLGFNFKDRLGSVVTVGDDQGNVIEHRSYDPFGKPRSGDFVTPTNTIKEAIEADPHAASTDMDPHTDRGFTDHEHLDEMQLIHMNGRVYDYNIGRFTSVDPLIQGTHAQAINPYSYIQNNPLAGTDPSGYGIVSGSLNCNENKGDVTECMAAMSGAASVIGNKGEAENDNGGNRQDQSANNEETSTIGSRAQDMLETGADILFPNAQNIDLNDPFEIDAAGTGFVKAGGNLVDDIANSALDWENPLANGMSIRDMGDYYNSLLKLEEYGLGIDIPRIDIAPELQGSEYYGGGAFDLVVLGVIPVRSFRTATIGRATGYKVKDIDLDWRGTGKSVNDAVNKAFELTGTARSEFEVTAWGRNAYGKSFPVEYRHSNGAQVNIDWAHAKNGPDVPHVGWQTPGKKNQGGSQVGHIFLDDVPYHRTR